jgi:acyl carrier protein
MTISTEFSGGAATMPRPTAGPGRSALEAEIRGFLADIFFLGDDPESIDGSQSLIEAGVIDSTGVMELVGFLEEQYGIRIEDDELVPENLDSIENMVRFVAQKQGFRA